MRTGVAIGADDDVARDYEAFFGQKRVLDAHVLLVEIIFQIVLIRKIAADFGLVGA